MAPNVTSKMIKRLLENKETELVKQLLSGTRLNRLSLSIISCACLYVGDVDFIQWLCGLLQYTPMYRDVIAALSGGNTEVVQYLWKCCEWSVRTEAVPCLRFNAIKMAYRMRLCREVEKWEPGMCEAWVAREWVRGTQEIQWGFLGECCTDALTLAFKYWGPYMNLESIALRAIQRNNTEVVQFLLGRGYPVFTYINYKTSVKYDNGSIVSCLCQLGCPDDTLLDACDAALRTCSRNSYMCPGMYVCMALMETAKSKGILDQVFAKTARCVCNSDSVSVYDMYART